MSEERITVTLELSNEELADGPRRQFAVPRALADRIGISNGDLVDRHRRGAPLRAWTTIAGDEEAVVVSSTGMDIMGTAPGDRVRLRATVSRPETAA